uniref:Uncharacterized protein n=1 Tax=Picea glauca TaxID=3330 RepID=A0A101LX94_PICGL|nr:hypothetical protein ABT39_MTgene6058 [Picea glauca]
MAGIVFAYLKYRIWVYIQSYIYLGKEEATCPVTL